MALNATQGSVWLMATTGAGPSPALATSNFMVRAVPVLQAGIPARCFLQYTPATAASHLSREEAQKELAFENTMREVIQKAMSGQIPDDIVLRKRPHGDPLSRRRTNRPYIRKKPYPALKPKPVDEELVKAKSQLLQAKEDLRKARTKVAITAWSHEEKQRLLFALHEYGTENMAEVRYFVRTKTFGQILHYFREIGCQLPERLSEYEDSKEDIDGVGSEVRRKCPVSYDKDMAEGSSSIEPIIEASQDWLDSDDQLLAASDQLAATYRKYFETRVFPSEIRTVDDRYHINLKRIALFLSSLFGNEEPPQLSPAGKLN
ncbi:unnamed protein product [Soboliphyme baturini]|uniref:SANT domain-containing protein n=1 Tax=Soboliphyme baturini TaxID=241478 RepID=A0A183J358_9BILA|nr:unnamed protein product [Soboliphyme baturini]